MRVSDGMTDADLRHIFTAAKATVPKPYDSDVPKRDQDFNVWLTYAVEAKTVGLRAVAAAAFDQAVTAIDLACNANHFGVVENPYKNALILGGPSENKP